MTSLIWLIETAWYIVPCWGINVMLNLWYLWKQKSPAVARYDAPLDGGRFLFDGYRILGQSTTWVGLPLAIISGIVLDFHSPHWYYGLIKGLAVYFGHAAGSFIKRRFGLPRGKFAPILDHGDSVILAGLIFFALGWEVLSIIIGSIILTLILQPVFSYSGYKLGLRDNPL